MGKYLQIGDKADVRAFPGATVRRLTDEVAFDNVQVAGYARILIHVGCNDISDLVGKRRYRHVSIFDMMARFRVLRAVIHNKNSTAVVLFSSVLPRQDRYSIFRPYIQGLNFALEKLCAKSAGASVFVPSFRIFLSGGKPRAELFAESDGLHLNGAGSVMLNACFQQAFTAGFLRTRLRCNYTRKLAALPY